MTTVQDSRKIFASSTMRELLEHVDRVASREFAVLITGETGVGKEVIARLVHQRSRRAASPFIDFSCAAIPEQLVESELFGYEQGAFSGALKTKPGLFELAHGGTLFLDEIGDLSKAGQAKLLRVLDGTPYYRLGGTRKVCSDARILAATNQRLEAAVVLVRLAGVRGRQDLVRRKNEIAKGRLLLDDPRVVLDVGRPRHAVDQRRDVGRAADLVEIARAPELLLQGHQIDGVVALRQLDHLVEDAPVGVAEEIAGVDHLGREVERVIVEQDGAQDRPFGFEIVGQRAIGDGFGHDGLRW